MNRAGLTSEEYLDVHFSDPASWEQEDGGVPLCLVPSSTGRLLCCLRKDHAFDQHVSFDAHGLLRGFYSSKPPVRPEDVDTEVDRTCEKCGAKIVKIGGQWLDLRGPTFCPHAETFEHAPRRAA